MQTFLPYSDFEKSAQVLDNKRLGSQRNEAILCLDTLFCGPYQSRKTIIHEWVSCSKEDYESLPKINTRKTPWYSHAVVKMWRGHEQALIEYADFICFEWVKRGFRDSCREKLNKFETLRFPVYPAWLGNEKFHSSHRAALLAKNFDYYKKFNWTEEPKIDYFWPSKENS